MKQAGQFKVGIAGTGKMGTAMGLRLLERGHSLTVYNRTAERAQPLLDAGGAWAESPQQLIQQVDVVLSLLSNEAAMDEVYQGPQGFLQGPAQDQLIIEMSTTSALKQQHMAQIVQARGLRYLESPVSGSVGPAREGKLMAFVGGRAEDLHRVQPLLSDLCRRIEHVGPHGAGATMKLAINLPLMVYWQTLSEALSLIQPLGLDPQRVVEMFTESSGGPNMLKVRGNMLMQALAGTPSPQVTVNLATMRKDVRAMVAHAASNGLQVPLTQTTLEHFERAAAQGMDDADCTQLPIWWLKSQHPDQGR
jgi:3-hydroxyisobutyrate dehydrogenase